MNITKSNQGGKTVMTVTGTVNIESAPNLRTAMHKEIDAKPTGVVLHLAGVDYMDSSGVGVLVSCLKYAKEKKIPFALAELSSAVNMVIEVTRLANIFTIYPDLASATK